VLLENADEAGSQQRWIPVKRAPLSEDVEGDRVRAVLGEKKQRLVDPSGWYVRQHRLNEVPVRINESNPAASSKVLDDQVLHQGRLAGASLAEEPDMPEPIVREEAEPVVGSPVGGLAEDEEMLLAQRRKMSMRKCCTHSR